MITQLAKIINDKKFDDLINQLSNPKQNLSVHLACPQITPLLAIAAPRPFVYVTPSIDGVEHALGIFKIENFAEAFIKGETDILVIPSAELNLKVPISKAENFELKKNDKASVKDIVSKLVLFGYERTDKPYKYGEFAVHGDTIDIWSNNAILRLAFFGDVLEDIKTLDPKTYLATKKLNDCIIPSIAINVDFVDLLEGIKHRRPTLIFDRPDYEIPGGFSHIIFHNKKSPLSLNTLPVPNYHNAFSVLAPDIIRKVEKENKTALVFVGESKAMANYMTQKKVPFVFSKLDKVETGKINIIYQDLGTSFELPDYNLVVYSTTDGKRQAPEQSNIITQNLTGSFTLPTVGQVVVHNYHGLGRYLGIKRLKLDADEQDYLLLQYDGGAYVYLPPEQADKVLSNYTGEPTRLSKIGGKDFAEAKQRVRRHIRELSFKLSDLYAKRLRVESNTYEVPDQIMKEFSAAFGHEHTKDQIAAIEALSADMKSEKVMDRLLCGDVGFGKTEVAMHAIFRAVMSGYQVALLAPTTILSIQHYNTAKERLAPFGIKVEFLNRFKTQGEQAQIIRDLADGKIDVIVGTHRLMSGDVEFHNIGLLVLDEEQRFGVAAKEHLKRTYHSVDVLTMTATPIPRTLNMALVGIRDISIISTPPIGRFPVITYVTEFDEGTVKNALLREFARGGQSIILYNDVQKINAFANRIVQILGNEKTQRPLIIGIVHGQMPVNQLEDTILALYDKKIDILIASTIVENGIDVQSANTLIVTHADLLGVAQMHQLRGRVGRRNEQAYAYFTYPKNKEVTEISQTRLNAIRNYSAQGAGIDIAMRDLEIRGAGDLLGAEQSGHIAQIGFYEYCKILEEEMNN